MIIKWYAVCSRKYNETSTSLDYSWGRAEQINERKKYKTLDLTSGPSVQFDHLHKYLSTVFDLQHCAMSTEEYRDEQDKDILRELTFN